jgi:hypothetical protein
MSVCVYFRLRNTKAMRCGALCTMEWPCGMARWCLTNQTCSGYQISRAHSECLVRENHPATSMGVGWGKAPKCPSLASHTMGHWTARTRPMAQAAVRPSKAVPDGPLSVRVGVCISFEDTSGCTHELGQLVDSAQDSDNPNSVIAA